jgi:hypothetical protein
MLSSFVKVIGARGLMLIEIEEVWPELDVLVVAKPFRSDQAAKLSQKEKLFLRESIMVVRVKQ